MIMVIISAVVCLAPVFLFLFWVTKNKARSIPLNRGLMTLLLSAVFVIPVYLIGTAGELLLAPLESFPKLYELLDNLLLAALPEEVSKFLAIYFGTKRFKLLRHRSDLLLYAVFAVVGFALPENIIYLFSIDIFGAVTRGLVGTTAHAVYTLIVVMFCMQGMKANHSTSVVAGLGWAILLHACTNFCMTMTSDTDGAVSYIALFLFIPAMVFFIWKICLGLSKNIKSVFLNIAKADPSEVPIEPGYVE